MGMVLERGLNPTVPAGAPPVSGATLVFPWQKWNKIWKIDPWQGTAMRPTCLARC